MPQGAAHCSLSLASEDLWVQTSEAFWLNNFVASIGERECNKIPVSMVISSNAGLDCLSELPCAPSAPQQGA
eukprot:2291099-Amphidinium_carterae.1